MRARVTSLQLDPNMTDGGIEFLEELLIPKLKVQKGFRGFLGLTNTEGKALTISLWETEADMTATESTGWYQAQVVKAAPLLSDEPELEHYEVRIKEDQG